MMIDVYEIGAWSVALLGTALVVCLILPGMYEDHGPRAAARVGLASIPGIPLVTVLWPLILLAAIAYGLGKAWKAAELWPYPRRPDLEKIARLEREELDGCCGTVRWSLEDLDGTGHYKCTACGRVVR